MTDKDFCAKQVLRLERFRGFPSGAEAKRDLVYALQCFATQQLAQAFMDDWISHEEFCPMPAAIRKAAFEINAKNNMEWLEKKKCPDCSGSGFRMVTVMKQAIPGMARVPYDFSVPCNHSGENQ